MAKKVKRTLCECRQVVGSTYGCNGHDCVCTINKKDIKFPNLLLIKVGH